MLREFGSNEVLFLVMAARWTIALSLVAFVVRRRGRARADGGAHRALEVAARRHLGVDPGDPGHADA